MTIYQGVDLLKAVERYESAFQEFRQAHDDVRDVLHDRLLFDRWQQLGSELGFGLGEDDELGDGDELGEGDLRRAELSLADLDDDLRELSAKDGAVPGMAQAWSD